MIRGQASLLGAASGAVAGLVAITPAAGFAGPMGAIVLGVVAGVVCYLVVSCAEAEFKYDDALDVFGVHGIGGIVGALGTASSLRLRSVVTRSATAGLRDRQPVPDPAQAVVIALVWSGVVAPVAMLIVKALFGAPASPRPEREGLDLSAMASALITEPASAHDSWRCRRVHFISGTERSEKRAAQDQQRHARNRSPGR